MTTQEALSGARELVADTGMNPLKALHLFVPDNHQASWLLWDAAEQVVPQRKTKMPSITSANVANAIIKLVAADALPALVGSLVMGNLVTRDYEPLLASVGDSVESYPDRQPIVLNTHAKATFIIPDVTKVLAVPDLLRIYMEPAVVAISEKIESDLLNLYAEFTDNIPVGTPGTPITEGVLDDADTLLFMAKVPANEPKYLVVDSNTYSAMRQIPRFSEYQTCGEAGLRNLIDSSIGKIKGFFVFRSRYVARSGSAPMAAHNLAFAKSALALAIRRLPQPLPGTGAIAEYAELGNFGIRLTMQYQPNTLSQQFTIDMLYGCAIARNNFAVQVNS